MTSKPRRPLSDNPMHGNPLRTRADVGAACQDLVQATMPYLAPGSGRLILGPLASVWETEVSELEGFSRLFWGAVPAAAGGALGSEITDRLRAGLAAGTDPDHADYWGPAGQEKRGSRDQRLCEMAPLALGLALAPEIYYDPLTEKQKANVTTWLADSLAVPHHASNWQYFRVIVALGLERVGYAFDWAPVEEHLVALESYYVDDGWYEDGPTGRYDHYIAFAMHFYGLIYAQLRGDKDPERAARMRSRAAAFAKHYLTWFGDDGSAIPYGRSLPYRFAHASFWGALAFAGVEGLPWPVIKRVYMQNLRWWSNKPIAGRDGVLELGYGYPNTVMIEEYSAGGSPYWALKAFLPLSLPESHPFWQAEEAEALPLDDTVVSVQPAPRMLVYRAHGDAVALVAGQRPTFSFRNNPAKYNKFAYSSRSGFSTPIEMRTLQISAPDSTLMVRRSADEHWMMREATDSYEVHEDHILARWSPCKGVSIETWLLPASPWHMRVHRILADEPLEVFEGGFAADATGDSFNHNDDRSTISDSLALANLTMGHSAIIDLLTGRTPSIVFASPGTNLMVPRTCIPGLTGSVQPGQTILACAVTEGGRRPSADELLSTAPKVPAWLLELVMTKADK